MRGRARLRRGVAWSVLKRTESAFRTPRSHRPTVEAQTRTQEHRSRNCSGGVCAARGRVLPPGELLGRGGRHSELAAMRSAGSA